MIAPAKSGRPQGAPRGAALGSPRLHLRRCDSTSSRARALALKGAPHGTLVTAAEQDAGRGRQGRVWHATAGSALLLSLVLRDWTALLPLAAAVAVAELAGARARIKWPNDVLLDGGKLSGILVEGRPREGWAVLGIGVNLAVDPNALPPEVARIAAGLQRPIECAEPTLRELIAGLERWLAAGDPAVLNEVGARDALLGRHVRFIGGEGEARGIDERGRLRVLTAEGERALGSGEVHLDSA